MSKRSKGHNHQGPRKLEPSEDRTATAGVSLDSLRGIPEPPRRPLIKKKQYEALLRPIHGELTALQQWVVATGAKVCVIFEGRDAAGTGGTIKAITEHVSPHVFRVVSLPPPSERERSELYIQRYVPHLPAAGEVVIFDRSWYSRASIERVMGLCSKDDVRRFLNMVPAVERAMVDSGIVLIKYWLEISPVEQTRRFESRIGDPRKAWQLTPMDLESYTRWDEHSKARDKIFAASDTPWAPWFMSECDDKRRARLNVISHFLERIPYTQVSVASTKLPGRQVNVSASTIIAPPRVVPERY